MQQVIPSLRIMNAGGSYCGAVYPPGLASHTNVQLHPEAPLVASLCLKHIRIARLNPTPGRSGSAGDVRVHNEYRCYYRKNEELIRVFLVLDGMPGQALLPCVCMSQS
jgi:hypothetical protein